MKSKLTILLLFILCHSIHAQPFTDSNLPIVIITTDIDPITGQPMEILDDPKILATMKIVYHPDGTRNYLTDQNTAAYLNYSGRIGIEIRGSSSQGLPKKPYSLTTLQNDNTSNNNVSILSMPSENDWILNALAYDASLMRDYLSYDLSRSMGNYTARGKYCEVIINGDYKGLYIFMEELKIDSERINILKMTTSDNSLSNISGGYITKCDKTTGGDPIAWSFQTHIFNYVDFIHESPKPDDITSQQNTYINNEFTSLSTVMNNQNASIQNGYPSKIDMPSFVDFMVMNELASNVDGYQLSTFFHKDRNDKLRAGPIWDFNLTYGLDVFGDRSQTNVWQFDNGDNVGAPFWKKLYENTTFKCYLSRRWNELTASGNILNYSSIATKIDAIASLLSESRVRENNRWNTISNYTTEINALKIWLQQRILWLNSQFVNTSSCSFPIAPALVISKIHYNPLISGSYTSNNLEFIELTNNSSSTINLSGYYFRELGITYIFPFGSTMSPNNKIYLASDSNTFTLFYGFAPFGVFTRNLSNKSQKLFLADPYGNIVDNVEYTDSAPWPIAADGTGPYLSLIDLNYDNALASSWTTSNQALGINNLSLYKETSIYPNPAESVLYVSNTNYPIKNYEIYDLLGRLISRNISEVTSNTINISTYNIAASNYILKITFENDISIYKKFIKK
jgi:hypothetical protein